MEFAPNGIKVLEHRLKWIGIEIRNPVKIIILFVFLNEYPSLDSLNPKKISFSSSFSSKKFEEIKEAVENQLGKSNRQIRRTLKAFKEIGLIKEIAPGNNYKLTETGKVIVESIYNIT